MPEFHSGVDYVFNQNIPGTSFDFGTYANSGQNPVLVLSNSTVGSINIDGGAPVPVWSYGTIYAYGHDTLVGGASSSEPYMNLTIGIGQGATLSNDGYLGTQNDYGGQINVGGGANATLENNGTFDPVHGGWAAVDANITGHGTIDIARGGWNSNLTPQGPTYSALALYDRVGNGQTIDFGQQQLSHEYLYLDKPQFIGGSLDNFGSNDTIVAAHTTVTSDLFRPDHAGHGGTLSLLAGRSVVAALHFDGNYNKGSFDVLDQADHSAYIAFNAADQGTVHILAAHA